MFRGELTVYALLAIVAGSASRTHYVNLVQKFNDKPLIESRFINVGNKALEPPAPETANAQGNVVFETNTATTVNERFPSAVLFGRTCGGTIISEKWVLSAGHCTLFTGGREVLAGTNNSADGSGVKIRVKKLYIHPLFTVGPYWLDATRFNITQVAAHWDFLLAELEEPLPLNDKTIKAAELDPFDTINGGTPVGYAGYGAEHHGETMRHDMHGMDMVTLPDAECASLQQYDTHSMLCARGVAPRYDSACNGDSGSGLVDEHNRLIGVASWVENDAFECRNGAKVVFGKVSVARPWIKQITGL